MKENEWVSINDRLPRIGEEVSIVHKIINPESIGAFDIYKNYLMAYDDSTYQWHHNFLKGIVTYWRPIQEKRPDFSKLREGDLLRVFWDSNKSFGKFDEIDSFDFMIIDQSSCCKLHIKINDIKKITRINLEEQKFEEI